MASYPQCITDISIHALLAESDGMAFSDMYPYDNFYPRSPCGERLVVNKQRPRSYIFLSTLSLRRATFGKNKNAAESQKFLSTLSLRRATLPSWELYQMLRISIHALLAESDVRRSTMADFDKIFLSTLSLRRATLIGNKIAFEVRDFYPRSPCGERLQPDAELYTMLRISIHALLAESDL